MKSYQYATAANYDGYDYEWVRAEWPPSPPPVSAYCYYFFGAEAAQMSALVSANGVGGVGVAADHRTEACCPGLLLLLPRHRQ